MSSVGPAAVAGPAAPSARTPAAAGLPEPARRGDGDGTAEATLAWLALTAVALAGAALAGLGERLGPTVVLVGVVLLVVGAVAAALRAALLQRGDGLDRPVRPRTWSTRAR